MVEELVQLLVGVVDAQLLEGVPLKVLESKDVQDADEPGGAPPGIGALVDVVHQPCEGAGVERLGHGVAVLLRLVELERDLGDIAADVDLANQEHLGNEGRNRNTYLLFYLFPTNDIV